MALSKPAHRTFVFILSLITLSVLLWLIYRGYSYYNEVIGERFFHEDYHALKPSGLLGHGYGIIGSLMIITGVTAYMVRKRFRTMYRFGAVKHWLEFHIFLCTLGPILILFHTSYKFGGIVAISFWSMVAVFISGIIGRFIYLQIPRSIEGHELSLADVRTMRQEIEVVLNEAHHLDKEASEQLRAIVEEFKKPDDKTGVISGIKSYFVSLVKIRQAKHILRKQDMERKERRKIIGLVKKDMSLSRKIARMNMMKNLFKYWHVAHLPFAFVMLIIMLIHVGVTIVFGYRWIF